ncbi:MAG: 3-mercaptopyruvate sulfurtransferase [Pseudomonadota bacterium]
MRETSSLVSSAWLAEHLNAPDLRIVDATWHMPGGGRDARGDYEAAHIPGAVFFDIDEIADTQCGLPHMLPPLEKFSARVRRLGLGDGCRIIVYDNSDYRTAARVWWMFRVFGHQDVAVLDGGLQKWRDEGRPVNDIPPPPRERHFTARADHSRVRDLAQMLANLASGREQVVDARARDRFAGDAPEPRPGVRAGHIPGSRNLPFTALYHADGTMKAPPALARLFTEAGVDLGRPIVTSCGSGVTACSLALALELVGHRQVAVYDGSWSEWGSQEHTPIATGQAPS